MNMRLMDKILRMLTDSKWHDLAEIEANIAMPSHKIDYILRFLKEQSYIDIQYNKIIITQTGLKLLELHA